MSQATSVREIPDWPAAGAIIGGIPCAGPMVARRADTTKRRSTRCPGERFIPVNDPCPRLQQELFELRAIRRHQPTRQTKTGIIRQTNRLIEMRITPDVQQRTKHLFIRHIRDARQLNDAGVSREVPL